MIDMPANIKTLTRQIQRTAKSTAADLQR